MENREDIKLESTDSITLKKYLTIAKLIFKIEDRMVRSELVYLALNVVIFLVMIVFILIMHERRSSHGMEHAFISLTAAVGMSICVYWAAFAMRLQLKLKIRYFQARYLERRINALGGFIFSDESAFFNPKIRRLESPDGQEAIEYPASGMMRMDGFLGGAKPRYLSWFMPALFFSMYMLIVIWVLLTFLSAL